MAASMREIIPGRLRLGNAGDERDPTRLLEAGIVAVVNVAVEEPSSSMPGPRRHRLAGQHPKNRHEALPDDYGVRLLESHRKTGPNGGAQSGAIQ